MGNNCCKKQSGNDSNVYSTKALMNMPNFNGMDIYFSTQNLSRLQGQCLVIFSDHKLKMKKSNLSQIVTQKQSRKIKQYVQAYLQNNQLSFRRSSVFQQKQVILASRKHTQQIKQQPKIQISTNQQSQPEYLLINFDIPTIRFNKLLIVFVQPWLGKTSIKKILEQRLIKALQSIEKLNIKELAIVQFDDELGIPTNVGAAIMARSIHVLSRSFSIITICCRGISNQLSYLSLFENFKQEATLTSYTKKSIGDSNYY